MATHLAALVAFKLISGVCLDVVECSYLRLYTRMLSEKVLGAFWSSGRGGTRHRGKAAGALGYQINILLLNPRTIGRWRECQSSDPFDNDSLFLAQKKRF